MAHYKIPSQILLTLYWTNSYLSVYKRGNNTGLVWRKIYTSKRCQFEVCSHHVLYYCIMFTRSSLSLSPCFWYIPSLHSTTCLLPFIPHSHAWCVIRKDISIEEYSLWRALGFDCRVNMFLLLNIYQHHFYMTQHYKLKAANTIQNFFIAWGCLVLLSIHLVILFYISVHNLIASGPHLQVMLFCAAVTYFVIRQLMHRWCPL